MGNKQTTGGRVVPVEGPPGPGRTNGKQEDMGKARESDPDFAGPVLKGRHCTDVLFLLLFIAFWAGMIAVASVAFKNGVPLRLLYGTDSYGNLCGVDNTKSPYASSSITSGYEFNLVGYKYLFYSVSSSPQVQLCMQSCPTAVHSYSSYTANGKTKSVSYQTYDSDGRFYRCIPNQATASSQYNTVNSKLSGAGEALRRGFGDLLASWKVLSLCAVIALALGVLWLIFLRIFAGFIVYTTLFAIHIALGGGGYYCYSIGKSFQNTTNSTSSDSTNANLYLGLAYALWGMEGIVLLLTVFFLKRVRLAVGIIKESSKAVGSMPLILFFPLVTFFFVAAFSVYWIAVSVYLMSMGTLNSSTKTVNYSNLQYLQLYHVFGYFWTSAFLYAISFTTIAGAIASWYFSNRGEEKQAPHSPVWSSLKRVLRYHLGSMALGSLILAIVQFIRYILAKIQAKLAKSKNKCAMFVLTCLQCCMWCVEKIIKFLSKNAYIQIAIYGRSFCPAAKDAFFLLLRNAARIATVNFIGDVMLLLGKIFITVGTVCAGLALMDTSLVDSGAVQSKWVPMFVVLMIGYVIGSMFLGVFDTAVETIIVCFCEDSERNDGSPGKQYFAPKGLLNFLSKKKADKTKD